MTESKLRTADKPLRIKWIRVLAYSVNVRRQVTEARDLEALSERLERLEESQDQDRGQGVTAPV